MYLRADNPERDSVLLFVESCTSMPTTDENIALIESTATLMRSALDSNDIAPLRELVRRAQEWCYEISDVLAAAGHFVIETLGNLPVNALHAAMERVAQIERAVLPEDVFYASRREGLVAIATG